MKPSYKTRHYSQTKNKPQSWSIDYNNGELVKTTIATKTGQRISVNLTYIDLPPIIRSRI
jgi:hypothetical protein